MPLGALICARVMAGDWRPDRAFGADAGAFDKPVRPPMSWRERDRPHG